MKSFKYEVIDMSSGVEKKGKIEAETIQEAQEMLEADNYIILSIKTNTDLFKKSGPKYKKKYAKYLPTITKRFAFLLSKGISISECLFSLEQEFKKEKELSEAFTKVSESINNGMTLSNGFQEQSAYFPHLFIKMVEIGELSGNLEKIMYQLSSFFDKNQKLQTKIKKSLSSPLITLFAALGVILFMIYYILPQMMTMFEAFNSELPGITKNLLVITNFMQNNILYLIIGVLALVSVVGKLLTVYSFKLMLDRVLLMLPVVGDYLTKYYLALFARTFGILLTSGIEVQLAFAICSDIINNLVIKESINYLSDRVEEGHTLVSSAESYEFKKWKFPLLFVSCMNVGERTGAIDTSMMDLADEYQYDIDNSSDKITLIVNTFMTFFLGFIVGYIALGMYLPIISMTDGLL